MIEMSLQEFLLVHSLTLLTAGLFIMAKTYSRKLSNPLWQKKRLKILERDNWTCKKCGDEKELGHFSLRSDLQKWNNICKVCLQEHIVQGM